MPKGTHSAAALLAEIREFLAEQGLSDVGFSQAAVGYPGLLNNLAKARTCADRTVSLVRAQMNRLRSRNSEASRCPSATPPIAGPAFPGAGPATLSDEVKEEARKAAEARAIARSTGTVRRPVALSPAEAVASAMLPRRGSGPRGGGPEMGAASGEREREAMAFAGDGGPGNPIRARIEAVRERADIVAVVGGAVKLGRGSRPRGKCPFHGSRSDSFALYPDRGSARCWGCGWSGDAIKFVADHYGLGFMDALERLERDHGLDGLAARPVKREKAARPERQRASVDSGTMGRHIWRTARSDPDSLRTYFRARGVPESMLGDPRFEDVRFHPDAPLFAWPLIIGAKGPVDCRKPPRNWPGAPAMAALVRRPEPGVASDRWRPIGLHVTYLSPSLEGKMERRGADGAPMAARKMLGRSLGGCVSLGRYRSGAPLFVGEGIETVLSGMALAGAGDESVGLAALSLDNLQGHARLRRDGALPLHAIEPDPERAHAIAFAHDAPVTGLIDADMAPLAGPRDRSSGEPRGLKLIERRGGPVVRRAVSGAERSAICAELFVRSWRAAGCARVRAVRPAMGKDFNDAARELAR